MTIDLTRSGVCACGVPVSLHFDRNRKVSCELAGRRFQQDALEATDAPPEQPLRDPHAQAGPEQSIFQRRLGVFQV